MKNKYQTLFLAISITFFFIVGIVYARNFLFDNVEQDNNPSNNSNNNTQTSLVPTGQKVAGTEIVFFIDFNENGVRDNKEPICEDCEGHKTVVKLSRNDKILLENRTIDAKGRLEYSKDDKLVELWGYFPSTSHLIPNFTFDDESNEKTILIPMYKTDADLGAVNANIEKINKQEITDTQVRVNYVFSELLPAFHLAQTDEKNIWVTYTPDLEELNVYYLAYSDIRMFNEEIEEPNNNYLAITWDTIKPETTYKNRENLRLIVPE